MWSNARGSEQRNGCYNREPLKNSLIVKDGLGHPFRDGHGKPWPIQQFTDIPDDMSKDCRYSIGYGNDPGCAGCRWNQYPQPQKEHGMTVTGMEHGPAVLLELDPTHPTDTDPNGTMPNDSIANGVMPNATESNDTISP